MLGTFWKWAKRAKHIRVNIFRDLDVDAARRPRRRNRVLTPDEILSCGPSLITRKRSASRRHRHRLAADPRDRRASRHGHRHDARGIDRPRCAAAAPGVVGPVARGHEATPERTDLALSHERMKREDDGYDSTDPFIAPLNAIAVALIKGARGRDNRRVLGPARINAKATTATMQGRAPAKLMGAIWKKHGFRYARPHDLRRTAATLVQSAVLPDRPMKWSVEEVGWLLGHRNEKGGPVTLVYARYDHFDEKRAMAATLERELNRILGAPAAKVSAAA